MSKTGLVEKARVFAQEKHKGNFRKIFLDGKLVNGKKPYFEHPKAVVSLLVMVTKDKEILAAGYLHDTLEDTNVTYEELEREFGKRVADMVVQVTKTMDGKFPIKTREGLMIKLADTLHNISDSEDGSYIAKKISWLNQALKGGKNV